MEQLLSLLKTIPEYKSAVSALSNQESVAITGIGQINRSHLLAGLYRDMNRPMILLCQDEMAARRLQEELKCFLNEAAPILPGRDLTFYDAAVVSRSWEQKRLRQLYDLALGKTPLQIMSWESMSQRTMPPKVLMDCAFTLEVGQEYPIDELITRLTSAGYSRCGMVEGSGQFAVRGGIVDIFSPAADQPIRAEFFGDELDTMGFFDSQTQRRSENIDSVTILPVAETQPHLHPKGLSGLCKDIFSLIARQKRRKNVNGIWKSMKTVFPIPLPTGIWHSSIPKWPQLPTISPAPLWLSSVITPVSAVPPIPAVKKWVWRWTPCSRLDWWPVSCVTMCASGKTSAKN